MEWFVRWFLRASLLWLGAGGVLGLLMAFMPTMIVDRPAHAHAALVGFLGMMVFGVAYHVVPRFTGRPLHSRSMAVTHFWAANAGLLLMVAGWLVRGSGYGAGEWILRAGAVVLALALLLFIINLWITLGPQGGPSMARLGGRPAARPPEGD